MGKIRSDDERRRSARIIDQEARRLTYLVENVLNFARSERRANRLRLEDTEVARELREVLDTFVGGQLRRFSTSQIEGDATEQALVLGHMRCT